MKPQNVWLILIVSLAVFIMSFDFNSLNDSLLHLAQHYQAKIVWVAWLPTIYFLVLSNA